MNDATKPGNPHSFQASYVTLRSPVCGCSAELEPSEFNNKKAAICDSLFVICAPELVNFIGLIIPQNFPRWHDPRASTEENEANECRDKVVFICFQSKNGENFTLRDWAFFSKSLSAWDCSVLTIHKFHDLSLSRKKTRRVELACLSSEADTLLSLCFVCVCELLMANMFRPKIPERSLWLEQKRRTSGRKKKRRHPGSQTLQIICGWLHMWDGQIYGSSSGSFTPPLFSIIKNMCNWTGRPPRSVVCHIYLWSCHSSTLQHSFIPHTVCYSHKLRLHWWNFWMKAKKYQWNHPILSDQWFYNTAACKTIAET